ncbi:MAG TPA: hypothetical protein VE398_02905 [Acidobacteriota bacterium]|nr:hypothetical protein [Acidobacteriota bacterium]
MQFSQGQRQLAIQAMDEAEERTARYYCIPPHRWQEMRYDLLTCQDREWEPFPDAVLARVQFLQRLVRSKGGLHAFYRIQLNDPGILTAALRENLDSNIYPFLVYIITHEMVHLVRLSTILEHPAALASLDESEERRVEHISHQILTGSPGIHSIIEKFGRTQPQFLKPTRL